MATIARLSVDLIANSAKFRKDLDKASVHSQRTFKKMEGHAQRTAKAFAFAGTALASAFAVDSVRTMGNFQEALSDVQAKTNGTRKEIDMLSVSMRNAAKMTKFTAAQTAEAGSFLAMAGLNIKEINGALQPTLDLAAATKTSVQSTADFMTNIMKGLGMTTEELTRAADVLSVTTANSNTNLTDLATAMSYAAPSARAMGMSIEETSALIGVMANAGIKGSVAGTALRASFGYLANQGNLTEAALAGMTGGMTNQQKVLKRLGVHTMDTTGKMRGLTEILQDLKNAGADEMDFVAIFGRRAGSALMQFANDGLEGARELRKELEGAEGAARRMAATQMDNLNGDVLLMKSQFQELQLIFAENGLYEFSRTATQGITDLMKRAEPAFAFLGSKMDYVAAALVPVATAAFAALTIAIWKLNVAMFANPVGLIILGLTAVGVAVYAAVKNFDYLKHAAGNLWGQIKMFFTNIGDFIAVTVHNMKINMAMALASILIRVNEWKLGFFTILNDLLVGVAEKINLLLAMYNKIPFLDDAEPVSFMIDTTATEAKLANLKNVLTELEQKKQNFVAGTFTPVEFEDDVNPNDPENPEGDDNVSLSDEVLNSAKSQWDELKDYQNSYYDATSKMATASWSSLIDEGTKGSKKLLMIKRAFAMKNIIMSSAEAMGKAMALGFPAAIPAGLKVAAATAIQMQQVKGQFHDGIDNVPNTGTYLLEQGERVVDNRLNKDLSNYLANQNNQSINTTNNPTLNFNVNGGDAEGVETMLRQHRGKFESMIRDIYNENAQNSPF